MLGLFCFIINFVLMLKMFLFGTEVCGITKLVEITADFCCMLFSAAA